VRVILVRDDKPRTRDRDDRGYGLPLVTTDLESTAEDLVARYASRLGIEQAFADARHIIGVGEARNRTRRAVERTVPFGLICFSIVTVWYALHSHCADDVASHRARDRWYTTKTEPSYDDMAVKLRRVIIAARFRGHALSRPPRKKPGPSSQPGQQPGHDQPKPRNTRAPRRQAPPDTTLGRRGTAASQLREAHLRRDPGRQSVHCWRGPSASRSRTVVRVRSHRRAGVPL
jgi:hypothetical protein